jgi:predicted lipoprotein with Yx(FWY)xxD motif
MKWLLGLTMAALGLTLTACGAGHGSTTQAGSDSGSRPGAAVSVAQNPAQGAILVDSKGRTLYLFEQDNGTTSACKGACARVWPAFTAGASPAAGSGVDAARLATADGQIAQQVTYNGHLLYSYSGDAAPGDVKGVGIPGWYPVSPSGTKVDKDDEGKSSGGGSGGGY